MVIRLERLSHELGAHAWMVYTPLLPRPDDPGEGVVLPTPEVMVNTDPVGVLVI